MLKLDKYPSHYIVIRRHIKKRNFCLWVNWYLVHLGSRHVVKYKLLQESQKVT